MCRRSCVVCNGRRVPSRCRRGSAERASAPPTSLQGKASFTTLFDTDHTARERRHFSERLYPPLPYPRLVLSCYQAWGGAAAGVPALPRGGASGGQAAAGGTGAETTRGQGPTPAAQARGRRSTSLSYHESGSISCASWLDTPRDSCVHLQTHRQTAYSSLFSARFEVPLSFVCETEFSSLVLCVSWVCAGAQGPCDRRGAGTTGRRGGTKRLHRYVMVYTYILYVYIYMSAGRGIVRATPDLRVIRWTIF